MDEERDEPRGRETDPSVLARGLLFAERHPVLAIAGVLIAVALVVGSVTSDGADEPDRGPGDSFGAMNVCQGAVKDKLKSPATAKFTGATATLDGRTWTVVGDVDAENSFGALLRQTYRCEAQHTVDQNWRTRVLSISR